MSERASGNPVEAVLFDYGVVLSGPKSPEAWDRMLEITGLPEDKFRPAYWAPRDDYDRGVYSGADYWMAAGRHAGLDLTEAHVRDLLEADNQLWTEVNEPMVAWAKRLQAAGTKTGVLSNLGEAMTEGVLERQGWLAQFNHLLWSHTVGMAKPDAAIYPRAIAGLGVAAERILFVDDREENAAGAIAAGMQAIRYTTQAEFEQEMERRGFGQLWRSGRF